MARMDELLEEERQRKAERARPKGGQVGVDLNPGKRQKAEKPEEPPPPTIESVAQSSGLSLGDIALIKALVTEHTQIGKIERDARGAKEALTNRIKGLVKDDENLHRVICGDSVLSYYPVPKSSIKSDKLLECGVSPGVIAECTVETTSWTLKIRGLDEPD
ncbi:MAG: hypothetical protein ACREJN_21500 [Nitrospiraceae bacterium]